MGPNTHTGYVIWAMYVTQVFYHYFTAKKTGVHTGTILWQHCPCVKGIPLNKCTHSHSIIKYVMTSHILRTSVDERNHIFSCNEKHRHETVYVLLLILPLLFNWLHKLSLQYNLSINGIDIHFNITSNNYICLHNALMHFCVTHLLFSHENQFPISWFLTFFLGVSLNCHQDFLLTNSCAKCKNKFEYTCSGWAKNASAHFVHNH